ncbi:hypothetical protein BGW42_006152 [Actinomortierella wolfii]|nr:hypothetical protein BGW42_006152 [Actinomortierella wolfii]
MAALPLSEPIHPLDIGPNPPPTGQNSDLSLSMKPRSAKPARELWATQLQHVPASPMTIAPSPVSPGFKMPLSARSSVDDFNVSPLTPKDSFAQHPLSAFSHFPQQQQQQRPGISPRTVPVQHQMKQIQQQQGVNQPQQFTSFKKCDTSTLSSSPQQTMLPMQHGQQHFIFSQMSAMVSPAIATAGMTASPFYAQDLQSPPICSAQPHLIQQQGSNNLLLQAPQRTLQSGDDAATKSPALDETCMLSHPSATASAPTTPGIHVSPCIENISSTNVTADNQKTRISREDSLVVPCNTSTTQINQTPMQATTPEVSAVASRVLKSSATSAPATTSEPSSSFPTISPINASPQFIDSTTLPASNPTCQSPVASPRSPSGPSFGLPLCASPSSLSDPPSTSLTLTQPESQSASNVESAHQPSSVIGQSMLIEDSPSLSTITEQASGECNQDEPKNKSHGCDGLALVVPNEQTNESNASEASSSMPVQSPLAHFESPCLPLTSDSSVPTSMTSSSTEDTHMTPADDTATAASGSFDLVSNLQTGATSSSHSQHQPLQMTYSEYGQTLGQTANTAQDITPALRDIQSRNAFAMAVNHVHLSSVGMTFTADPTSFVREAKRARVGTEPGVQPVVRTPSFEPSMVRALDLGGQAAEKILATAKGRYGQMMHQQHAIQSSLMSASTHEYKPMQTPFMPSNGSLLSPSAVYSSPTPLGHHMPAFSPSAGTPHGTIPTNSSISSNPMTPVNAVAPLDLVIPNANVFTPVSSPHLVQPFLDIQRQKELLQQQSDIPIVVSRKKRKRHSRVAVARDEEKPSRPSPETPQQVRLTSTVSKIASPKEILENDLKTVQGNEDSTQLMDIDFAAIMTQAPVPEKQEKLEQDVPIISTQPTPTMMNTNTWPLNVFGNSTLTFGCDPTSFFLNSHEMQQELTTSALQLQLHGRQENDTDSAMLHSPGRHRSPSVASNGQSSLAEVLKQQQTGLRSRSSSTTSVPTVVMDGKDGLTQGSNEDDSDLPVKCEHCDKRFPSRGLLRSHVVSHTDERPFECLDCGNKSYKRNHDLLRHQREKHPHLFAQQQQQQQQQRVHGSSSTGSTMGTTHTGRSRSGRPAGSSRSRGSASAAAAAAVAAVCTSAAMPPPQHPLQQQPHQQPQLSPQCRPIGVSPMVTSGPNITVMTPPQVSGPPSMFSTETTANTTTTTVAAAATATIDVSSGVTTGRASLVQTRRS